MNPESDVIAEIDALIDDTLAAGEHDGWDVGIDICPHCKGEWHGLADWHCPGAVADEAAVEEFRQRKMADWDARTPPGISYADTFDRDLGAVDGGPWFIPGDNYDPSAWLPHQRIEYDGPQFPRTEHYPSAYCYAIYLSTVAHALGMPTAINSDDHEAGNP